MGFKKALQYTNSEAMHRFKDATIAYRNACKIHSELRIAASHPKSSEDAIVRYHRARPAFKQACVVYNEARIAYANSVTAARTPISQISNKDIMLLEQEVNNKTLGEELRKEAIVKDFGGHKNVYAIIEYLEERRAARAEGFDLEAIENADSPIVGNTMAFDESAANPLDLDSDPFGDNTLKARGVK
jgi:hypothetical protein